MNGSVRGRPDFLLLFLILLLVGFGMVMIFSASSATAYYKYGSPLYYVYKQGIFALAGFIIMLFFMAIPYPFWKKTAPFLLVFSLLLLVLVLVAGVNINGAKRWFVVGSFNFQPAEFSKLAIIVYLSAMISKKGPKFQSFRRGLLPLLLMIGFMLLLVMKQPDFGTVMILAFISCSILLVGGVNLRHFALLCIAVIPLFVFLAVSKSYRFKRLSSFLNPFENQSDSGYQLIQSLYALGHGGFTGTGLGKSVQKLFYLPEAHTDFIFAVIGEELGFVGSSLFLLVFFLFIWRGFITAVRSQDPFAHMLGMGIVSMIFIQFLLNLGAVTGMLPITGVPLPLTSYGGSSLILCMACTGILLNISRDNHRRRLDQQQASQSAR